MQVQLVLHLHFSFCYTVSMENKHTPGPWKVVKLESCLTVKGPEGCRVASLFMPREEMNEANARLIAAAPDMLAALRGAANHLQACQQGELTRPFTSASLPLVLKAIAKAEGR